MALADLGDLELAAAAGLVEQPGDVLALVGDRVFEDLAGAREQGWGDPAGLLGGRDGFVQRAKPPRWRAVNTNVAAFLAASFCLSSLSSALFPSPQSQIALTTNQ